MTDGAPRRGFTIDGQTAALLALGAVFGGGGVAGLSSAIPAAPAVQVETINPDRLERIESELAGVRADLVEVREAVARLEAKQGMP